MTVCCTHPLFSGQALARLNSSPIGEVVVSNTIPFNRFEECPKVKVMDMSGLLADAIGRIHREQSVSNLFLPSLTRQG